MSTQLAKDRIFMLIKFKDNLDHLKSIQQGQLYMNNGNFFKELEETSGVAGVGDKYEMSQILRHPTIEIKDPETNEFVGIGGVESAAIRLNTHMRMPLFCLTQIDSTSLRIVKEVGESVDCKLDFGGQDIEEIINDFGEHALIIDPSEFKKRVNKAAERLDLRVLQKKVIYEDYSVTSKERLKAQRNNDPNYYFFKRNEFAYQREYRIVLPGVQTDIPYTFNIGDISDISHIFEARELFEKAVLKMHD